MANIKLLEHLLPKGGATKLTTDRALTRYVQGLANGAPASFKDFVGAIWFDLIPASSRLLSKWESQFGLFLAATEEDRIANVDAAWKNGGGQGLDHIQDLLRAAGFDVYVHSSLSGPSTYYNPNDFLDSPTTGVIHSGAALAHCGEEGAVCAGLLQGVQDYLVNKDLTNTPQPPILDDPATFPFWVYIGGETFPDRVIVDNARRLEFESLLLSVCPGHYWIGLLIDYEGPEFIAVDENGFILLDAGGFIQLI